MSTSELVEFPILLTHLCTLKLFKTVVHCSQFYPDFKNTNSD